MRPARRLWEQIETIHAVTYFAPESAQAARHAGLRGFWMGYFGFRAAPLGAVTAGVVEGVFANFAPTMVRRSIPDAWSFARPADLITTRSSSAAAALRRLAPDIAEVSDELNGQLESAIGSASSIGRPLFAANAGLDQLGDPVERLWQNCTTLREHRGDGHVAALASHGIDGCEAHLLIAAEHGWDPAVFFDNRGWTSEDQSAANDRLRQNGLLNSSGLTTDGRHLRNDIEETTDTLADAPYQRAGGHFDIENVHTLLHSTAEAVRASETIPFPNPMGLPPPSPIVPGRSISRSCEQYS